MRKLTIADKSKIFVNSFFRGLKNADDIMLSQVNGENGGTEITEKMSGGGVFKDMLQEKETQQVKELRDRYYRILNEADKYHVDIKIVGEGDDEKFIPKARKKNLLDYSRHCDVLIREGETLDVIQDNKQIAKPDLMENLLNPLDQYNYLTTLDIERDGYRTRFDIEKFVSKIVVKSLANSSERKIVDLYLPTTASQFGKMDAILISALNKVFTEKPQKVDFFTFDGMSFMTDGAWGKENLCEYKFSDVRFEGMDVYDGQFVAKFNCKVDVDGKSITEKYRMKEVDKKYAEHALNDGAVPNIEIAAKYANKIDGTQDSVSFKL